MGAIPCRCAEEDDAQPQSAPNGLFHEVHALDGNFALLVRTALVEQAPQLLHLSVLPAADVAQAIFKLELSGHGGGWNRVYRTPRKSPDA